MQSTRATGAGLGAVTGVIGVGGGFLALPALVSVLDLRMRHAVGTSLLVITVNSMAAMAMRGHSREARLGNRRSIRRGRILG